MRTADDTRELSPAAWLALAAAFVVMAGQFAVAKRGLSTGLTAYDIVALRFVGAAIPAAVILGRRGVRDLAGVGYGRGAFLALIAGSPYALLMYLALRDGARDRPRRRIAFAHNVAVANVLGRGGVAQATASAEIVRTTPRSHSDRHVLGERTWPSRRS